MLLLLLLYPVVHRYGVLLLGLHVYRLDYAVQEISGLLSSIRNWWS